MPDSSAATDVLGIGTLVLVLLSCLFGAFSIVYIVLFHFRSNKLREPLLQDFDSPWIARMVLVCFFILWNLGEALCLPWSREKDRVFEVSSQVNLCKAHVVWSLGLMEPGLLLIVLFLVHGALQEGSRKHINVRVLALMCLCGLPIFVLQVIVAMISNGEGSVFGVAKLPSYFTSSYEKVVLDGANVEVELCTYPLLSILPLALFFIVFMPYFTWFGFQLLRNIINRKLRARVYWLVSMFVILLPIHVGLLGVSSVVSRPGKAAHEAFSFLGFMSLLLIIGTAVCILVVLPIFDATAVHHLFHTRHYRSRNHQSEGFRGNSSSSPHGVFSRGGGHPNAVVSDDDDASSQGLAKRSLLGAVSQYRADASTSSSTSARGFDAISKDLTLGPGAWLVDVPGSVVSPPSSPTLLGAPLIFL